MSAEAILGGCANGRLPVNIALFQLFASVPIEVEARSALNEAIERVSGEQRTRLERARDLWNESPGAFELINRAIRRYESTFADERGGSPLDRTAKAYDEVAALSPEASVALYSLGRSDILGVATAELVDKIASLGMLGPGCSVLEVGCGNGRVLSAIAPHVRSIDGIDISERMLEQARVRCASLENVRLHHGDGRRYPLDDASVDLVLAVDSFPDLVDAGLDVVRDNFAESARVLKPGGGFVLFNFSSRGDFERDVRDVDELASAFGFELLECGLCSFQYWDGVLFRLQASRRH